jgi:gamma-glutamyltranspeptidase / glutathione hydrolase
MTDVSQMDNFSVSQRTLKPAVASEQGVVAAQHIGAARVGAQVLADGGNAVDAAIATSLAIGVLEPWMSGLAAGGCMMVWLAKEQRAVAVNFGMRSPLALNPLDYPLSSLGTSGDLFAWPKVLDDRNERGSTAVAVPGLVAGLALAHELFGSKDWAELVSPAVSLAHSGMLTDWYSALMTGANAKALSRDPDAAAYFLDEGKWPVVGGWTSVDQKRLNQTALAHTLERLRDVGPSDFYKGLIGQQLVDDVGAKGGCLSMQDLDAYEAELATPTSWTDGQHHIFAAPELTGGPTLVRALELLQSAGFDDDAANPGCRTYQAIAKALTEAFRERLQSMGDHESSKSPGSTTHFSVVDRDGNICAVTQTLLSVFGSKVVSPSTGLLLNNGIMWFDPQPDRPNSLTPGKRCLTNYSPIVGLTHTGLSFGLGASGGRKILGAVLQIALFMMRHQMSLEQAMHQPRIDVSGLSQIIADSTLPDEIINSLTQILPTEKVRRQVYPYAYACPAGVARLAGMNYGATEIFTPWGDAVAADGP